jgi:plastocyanin
MLKVSLERFGTIVTFALVLGLAGGCGGGEGGGEQAGGEMAGGEEGGAMESVVDPATAGSISGSISFQGTPPEPQPIDMSEEPTCAEKHEGQPVKQTVVVNDNGTLKNVFVYVKSGLPDVDFPTPEEPVVIDQTGCQYEPHVMGIQVGQPLQIKNSDGILHNINATPQQNRGFNISQPVEMSTERTFSTPEIMVPVECDVHGWMKAYIGVLDNPYFDTTGDDGSFEIDNLPPGTYTIEAWHEDYGTQTQEVTVGESEDVEVTFTFGPGTA